MAKRITIMLDENLDRKIRLKQSKLILKSKKGVSFSNVLNQTLRECLRK